MDKTIVVFFLDGERTGEEGGDKTAWERTTEGVSTPLPSA